MIIQVLIYDQFSDEFFLYRQMYIEIKIGRNMYVMQHVIRRSKVKQVGKRTYFTPLPAYVK